MRRILPLLKVLVIVSYWVSGEDISKTQIVVGENVKKVAIVFRNISRVSMQLPIGAKLEN